MTIYHEGGVPLSKEEVEEDQRKFWHILNATADHEAVYMPYAVRTIVSGYTNINEYAFAYEPNVELSDEDQQRLGQLEYALSDAYQYLIEFLREKGVTVTGFASPTTAEKNIEARMRNQVTWKGTEPPREW